MAGAEDLINSGPAGGPAAVGTGQYHGVPDGYMAKKIGRAPSQQNYMGPVPSSEYGVAPRYKKGDEYSIAAGRKPGEIEEMQADLLAAGLIQPGKRFKRGVWDETTAGAYRKALEYANQQGLDAGEAIDTLINTPEVNGEGDQRKPLMVELPNPEDVKASIKKASRSILGRNLDPAALERMAAAYNADLVRQQEDAYKKALMGENATVVDPMSLETYAEQQIRSSNPGEAGAHDFSENYNAFSELLGQSKQNAQWGS